MYETYISFLQLFEIIPSENGAQIMLSTELFLSPRAAKMSIYKSALPVSSFFTLQKEVLPIASPEAASSPYDGRRSKHFIFKMQSGVTRDT